MSSAASAVHGANDANGEEFTRCCNRLLMLTGGVMPYASSDRFLVANRFVRAVVQLLCVLKVLAYAYMLFANEARIFRSLVFISMYTSILVFQHKMLQQEQPLRAAVATLIADLTPCERRTLRTFDRRMSVAWVIFFFAQITLYVSIVVVDGPHVVIQSIYDVAIINPQPYHHALAMANIVIYAVFISGFFVSTVVFYALIEAIFDQYGTNCVKTLNKRLNRKQAKAKASAGAQTRAKVADLVSVRAAYRKYNRLRRRVNASIGMLPFLWTLVLFARISMGITEVIIHRDNYTYFALVYIFYEILSFGAVFFALCFLCERTNVKLRNEMLRGIRFIEASKHDDRFLLTCEKNNLLLEMAVDPSVAASGWNIFALDKKLISK